VAKPDGSVRMSSDFKSFTIEIVKNKYPMLKKDELSNLSGSKSMTPSPSVQVVPKWVKLHREETTMQRKQLLLTK
jgi:hypothetical protein